MPRRAWQRQGPRERRRVPLLPAPAPAACAALLSAPAAAACARPAPGLSRGALQARLVARALEGRLRGARPLAELAATLAVQRPGDG